jgi:chemotaxis protein CheD
MRQIVVGIADCKVSRDPGVELVTYALGSCIGVAAYDPKARAGGLLHFMLPESDASPERSRRCPFMFADTAIPMLLAQLEQAGAEKRRLVVRAAGGAQVADVSGIFNVGKRNQLALRRLLWRAGLFIHGEDLGGTASRTVRLNLADGTMTVRSPGEAEREILARGIPARSAPAPDPQPADTETAQTAEGEMIHGLSPSHRG